MKQLAGVTSGPSSRSDLKNLGFWGTKRGFFWKNPVPEILIQHGLRAIIGVFGVLFQLQEYFLKLSI